MTSYSSWNFLEDLCGVISFGAVAVGLIATFLHQAETVRRCQPGAVRRIWTAQRDRHKQQWKPHLQLGILDCSCRHVDYAVARDNAVF